MSIPLKKRAEIPALEMLQKRLREHMNSLTDDMAEGSCKNYPDYTRRTGEIHGLAVAERELLDLDTQLIQE